MVFALSGYLGWTYFSSTLTTAALSLVTNAELVKKVYFPRLAAPVSALLPGLMNLLPGLVLLAALMAYLGLAPTPALFALPLWLLALAMVSLGVGLLLATLNVRYRDVASIIATLIQLWLFASPVADVPYPTSPISVGARWVYGLNPMVGVIDAFRWCPVAGPWPGDELLASAGPPSCFSPAACSTSGTPSASSQTSSDGQRDRIRARLQALPSRRAPRHRWHAARCRHPVGAPTPAPRARAGRQEIWSLRDVSLSVPEGDTLGVIGRNGAGKRPS